jgi:hypothetical protein
MAIDPTTTRLSVDVPLVDDLQVVLEALVHAGSAMWVWDIATDQLFGGGGVQQLLGYPANASLFPTQQDWNAQIHPDDRIDNELAYQAHARGERDPYEHTYRARAADGSWRWLLERGRVVAWDASGAPQRMVGTATDITARIAAEQHEREIRRRLSEVADNLPGVLFQMVSDATGKRFTYVGERCVSLLGIPADALLADSQRFESLRMLDDTAREALARIDPLRSSGPWVTEHAIRHPDGGERWLRVTSHSTVREDGSVAWNGYMEDATEHRALEDARRREADAVAANAAKTRFLSRISHELRTPLNAVLGFSQLMLMDTQAPPTPTQRQRLKLVHEAGQHLLRMIGDLLDLTRIEGGHLPMTLEAVDAGEAVGTALAMLEPLARAAGVRLQAPPPGERVTVRADRTRLQQILLNLLGNAIKYNRRGSDGEVRVTLEPAASGVRIAVHDNGIGIAEGDLARLFRPFERLPAAAARAEGTGIGLTVSQALAVLMEGTIEVASRLGVGSTFTLVLPTAADRAS